jgi:large subunit ribosomal protein L6
MSKIGKNPIVIPDNVEVLLGDRELKFKGPKGALSVRIPNEIKAEMKDKSIIFQPKNDSKQARASWGTARSLAMNALIGVTEGFEKSLELEGVGYRASLEGQDLTLNIGFSHPLKIPAPEGIVFSVSKNVITISGIDKDLVGKTAAAIRALRKVEPYKGKGIRYQGEVIRRKAGKKVAGTATK